MLKREREGGVRRVGGGRGGGKGVRGAYQSIRVTNPKLQTFHPLETCPRLEEFVGELGGFPNSHSASVAVGHGFYGIGWGGGGLGQGENFG